MFFPDRIKNISRKERVLEVGPGGLPHPRSNVLLEKCFDQKTAEAQRGYAPALKTQKKIVFYDSEEFPFKDHEFDYVICSHVLEHVQDVQFFTSELQRVAKKGYLEFPTVYYDFIYNFPEHLTLLLYQERKIYFLDKKNSGLNDFLSIQRLFYESLKVGYDSLIVDLKEIFFQGFEWFERIETRQATCLDANVS